MAIPGFKRKKDEVLNHWIAFAENFSLSPQEFYRALEETLAAHNIPGLTVLQEDHSEGGLFSGKRVYLRMIRERLAFDMCAAPFGTDYFFSCRTVYSPASVRFWHILVVLLILGGIDALLVRPLGTNLAAVAVVGLVVALAQVFRNTLAFGLSDLDSALLKIPAIGPIYERWFRKETFYRQDTRLMYLQTIPKLARELAEHMTGEKGIRLVQQYQVSPVLGELYKPLFPRESPGANITDNAVSA